MKTKQLDGAEKWKLPAITSKQHGSETEETTHIVNVLLLDPSVSLSRIWDAITYHYYTHLQANIKVQSAKMAILVNSFNVL